MLHLVPSTGCMERDVAAAMASSASASSALSASDPVPAEAPTPATAHTPGQEPTHAPLPPPPPPPLVEAVQTEDGANQCSPTPVQTHTLPAEPASASTTEVAAQMLKQMHDSHAAKHAAESLANPALQQVGAVPLLSRVARLPSRIYLLTDACVCDARGQIRFSARTASFIADPAATNPILSDHSAPRQTHPPPPPPPRHRATTPTAAAATAAAISATFTTIPLPP